MNLIKQAAPKGGLVIYTRLININLTVLDHFLDNVAFSGPRSSQVIEALPFQMDDLIRIACFAIKLAFRTEIQHRFTALLLGHDVLTDSTLTLALQHPSLLLPVPNNDIVGRFTYCALVTEFPLEGIGTSTAVEGVVA